MTLSWRVDSFKPRYAGKYRQTYCLFPIRWQAFIYKIDYFASINWQNDIRKYSKVMMLSFEWCFDLILASAESPHIPARNKRVYIWPSWPSLQRKTSNEMPFDVPFGDAYFMAPICYRMWIGMVSDIIQLSEWTWWCHDMETLSP